MDMVVDMALDTSVRDSSLDDPSTDGDAQDAGVADAETVDAAAPELDGVRALFRGNPAGEGTEGFDVYETTLATGERRRLGPKRATNLPRQLGASQPRFDATGERALVLARYRGEAPEALLITPCRMGTCVGPGVVPLLPEPTPAQWVGWGPGDTAALVAAGNALFIVPLQSEAPGVPRQLSDELFFEPGVPAAKLAGPAVVYRTAAGLGARASAVELRSLSESAVTPVRLSLVVEASATDPDVTMPMVTPDGAWLAFALPWSSGGFQDDKRVYVLDVSEALDGNVQHASEVPRADGTGYHLVGVDQTHAWIETWTSPYGHDRRLLGMPWTESSLDGAIDTRNRLATVATTDQGPPVLCGDHVAALWPREAPTAALLYRLSAGTSQRVELGTTVTAVRPRFSGACDALYIDDMPKAWVIDPADATTASMRRLPGQRALLRPGSADDYVIRVGDELLLYTDDGEGVIEPRLTPTLTDGVVRQRQLVFVGAPGDGSVTLQRLSLDATSLTEADTLLVVPGAAATDPQVTAAIETLAVDAEGRITFAVTESTEDEMLGLYELDGDTPRKILGNGSGLAYGAKQIALAATDRVVVVGDYDGTGLQAVFEQGLQGQASVTRLSGEDTNASDLRTTSGELIHFVERVPATGQRTVVAVDLGTGMQASSTRFATQLPDGVIPGVANDGWLAVAEAGDQGFFVSEGLVSPAGRYFAALAPFPSAGLRGRGLMRPVPVGAPATLHLLSLDALASDAPQPTTQVSDAPFGDFAALSSDGDWLLYSVADKTLRSRKLSTHEETVVVVDDTGTPLEADVAEVVMPSSGRGALLAVAHCRFLVVDRQSARAFPLEDLKHAQCPTASAADRFAFGDHNGVYLVNLSGMPGDQTTIDFNYVDAMAFSPDGRHLALSSHSAAAPVLAVVDTGQPERTPLVLESAVPDGRPVVFSRDGRWIAAPYVDGWDDGYGVWSTSHAVRLAEIAPTGWQVAEPLLLP